MSASVVVATPAVSLASVAALLRVTEPYASSWGPTAFGATTDTRESYPMPQVSAT
jgi:hypothetical protein